VSADDKGSSETLSATVWHAVSPDTVVTEFCDTSATEVLSTESSETAATSAVTLWPTACAGTSHEPSVSVAVSRLRSEFTINSSDLVLRSRGRFAGVGPVSAFDCVSLLAGDGTLTDEDTTITSGVVLIGGVATRLVPLDGDGVASSTYIYIMNIQRSIRSYCIYKATPYIS